MALIRTTLAEARTRGRIDQAKIDATTEEDIERHMREDGQTEDLSEAKLRPSYPAAFVRKKWGISQARFAEVIGVPVGTLRNWEQGRVFPDAAARTLLTVMAREPEAVLRALEFSGQADPAETGVRSRRTVGFR